MIQGVSVVDLETHYDDRGYLFEILREVDPYFTRFGQVYLVADQARGVIRAFHKHKTLWDWFCIVHGSAKFVLQDDRENSPTYGEVMTVVVGERRPRLIAVPPGVYHGWMSLEDDTLLVSTGSEVYRRDNPDEVRIPPDSFGDVWTVRGR